MHPLPAAEHLHNVLKAAARAPGNQQRFLDAGLMDESGVLTADWPTAFARLEPLSKAAVRTQPGQFLAQATDVVFRGKTSGTQGDAFTYFAGTVWNQKRIEARQRSLETWDIDPNIPIVNLASRLFPVRCHDRSLVGKIDDDFLQMLLDHIAHPPIILRGYPSRLCEVAIAIHNTSLKPDAVIAVISTGECLFEFQRVLLGKTFQAPVINEYGCQEAGISGLSCPAGRLHLDSDRCLYEIVAGELLTTDLYNATMPLVRYNNGDVLKLFTTPCPCGRAGLTAQFLGRQAEAIGLAGKTTWPGELELPPFPDILTYAVQIHPERHRVWVRPSHSQPDLTCLKTWIAQTLGSRTTEVILESPWATPALAPNRDSLHVADSDTWLQQVTTQSWSSWLNHPLPSGRAKDLARLLQQLVAPRQVVLLGLPSEALELFDSIRQSPVTEDHRFEVTKLRVLLWTLGLMAGDIAFTTLDRRALYLNLLERFQQWAKQEAMETPVSALGLDLFAPLLTLDTPITQELWPLVTTVIHQTWPHGLKADRFTLHHYLAILDQAGQKAQRQSHPWLPALRPFSAILQGDLGCFATCLDQELVATWAEMIHNCPGQWTTGQHPVDFRSRWQCLRQALLQRDEKVGTQQLSRLFDQAQSPSQVAQCWLEKGYASLVLGNSLDPMEWAPILQQQIGLLSSSGGHPNRVSNPTPWVPILNALAPRLIEAAQPTLAYACLLAAAPPHRHLSNFDRQTQDVNGKQFVLSFGKTP